MRGVSTPSYQFSILASEYLRARGDPKQVALMGELAACCRAYTRVVLRLRESFSILSVRDELSGAGGDAARAARAGCSAHVRLSRGLRAREGTPVGREAGQGPPRGQRAGHLAIPAGAAGTEEAVPTGEAFAQACSLLLVYTDSKEWLAVARLNGQV